MFFPPQFLATFVFSEHHKMACFGHLIKCTYFLYYTIYVGTPFNNNYYYYNYYDDADDNNSINNTNINNLNNSNNSNYYYIFIFDSSSIIRLINCDIKNNNGVYV